VKRQRQQAIRDLVARTHLRSQEEIRERLESLGYPATQSTISRDLEELGLVRVRDGDGHLRYALPDQAAAAPRAPTRALLSEFALSVEVSGNLVLVKTPPGAANAVAEGLDRGAVDGILGTVAGDNTILIVVREGVRGSAVATALRELAGLP
jgi:transcriptional regulator of arginine metabolism